LISTEVYYNINIRNKLLFFLMGDVLMAKVKFTVREINATLSALKVANDSVDIQKELESWISFMLEKKMQYFEIDEDNPVCEYIRKLSSLHTQLVRVQKRRR